MLLAECLLGQALLLLDDGSFAKAACLLEECQAVMGKFTARFNQGEGNEMIKNAGDVAGFHKLLGDVCSAFFFLPCSSSPFRLEALERGEVAYRKALAINCSTSSS